ncbi:MAG TPA: ATP-binding protein [Steroidobacteraceae bacterium]|nr:ATP-binding protein [Steroidobacteraceae bacterium]
MQSRRVEIRFPGTHHGFAQGFTRLLGALDAAGLEGASRYNAELVFEEIVDNIVSHGAVDGSELEVRVTLEVRPDSIILTFDDNGVPFDPRGIPDPEPPKSLEQARIGGFGVMLVRRAAHSLDYLRTAGGRNLLTVQVERAGATLCERGA